MKKKIGLMVVGLAFLAGVASAAVVITYYDYNNVVVSLDPIGACGTTGDCLFKLRVNGNIIADDGSSLPVEAMMRSDDAVLSFNQSAMSTIYRRARREWKKRNLADDTN